MRCPYTYHVICAYIEIEGPEIDCSKCPRRLRFLHETPPTPVKEKIIKKLKHTML